MKQVALSNSSLVALVDDEDFDKINKYTWHVYRHRNTYYAKTNIWSAEVGSYRGMQMHRLIMEAKRGQLIDHKDRNGLNNQKTNLRFCSCQENARNRAKNTGNHLSKYKGVTFDIKQGLYTARIFLNGRVVKLATMKNEEDAAHEYDLAALHHFGEFAYLNFPNFDYTKYSSKKRGALPKSSKYQGVFFRTERNSWGFRCLAGGNRKIVTGFGTEEEAYEARQQYLRSQL